MLRFLLLATVVVLAACASPAGRTRPAGTAPSVAPAARDSLAGPWTFRNLGRPRSHRVTLSAVLHSRIDTLTREDTLASQTLLEWSVDPLARPPRVLGMVRDFAISMGSDSSWRALPDLALPVSFLTEQPRADAQPRFLQPADTSCDARAAVVQALRETWLSPPAQVAQGTQWRDSSTYALCRDGIVLEATAVRDYAIESADVRDHALVLLVRRRTQTRLHGEGLQFGDSIRVTGESQGEALLEVALDGAAIVFGSGSSMLRLQLEGRRRTQELVQHGALVIRAP